MRFAVLSNLFSLSPKWFFLGERGGVRGLKIRENHIAFCLHGETQMPTPIDARGLSCPQPVILTLNAMKKGADALLEVLVDTSAARENVTRAATGQGWTVSDTLEADGSYRLTLNRPA